MMVLVVNGRVLVRCGSLWWRWLVGGGGGCLW